MRSLEFLSFVCITACFDLKTIVRYFQSKNINRNRIQKQNKKLHENAFSFLQRGKLVQQKRLFKNEMNSHRFKKTFMLRSSSIYNYHLYYNDIDRLLFLISVGTFRILLNIFSSAPLYIRNYFNAELMKTLFLSTFILGLFFKNVCSKIQISFIYIFYII